MKKCIACALVAMFTLFSCEKSELDQVDNNEKTTDVQSKSGDGFVLDPNYGDCDAYGAFWFFGLEEELERHARCINGYGGLELCGFRTESRTEIYSKNIRTYCSATYAEQMESTLGCLECLRPFPGKYFGHEAVDDIVRDAFTQLRLLALADGCNDVKFAGLDFEIYEGDWDCSTYHPDDGLRNWDLVIKVSAISKCCYLKDEHE